MSASCQHDQIERINACCPQAEDLPRQFECWITCACRELAYDVLRHVVLSAKSVAQQS